MVPPVPPGMIAIKVEASGTVPEFVLHHRPDWSGKVELRWQDDRQTRHRSIPAHELVRGHMHDGQDTHLIFRAIAVAARAHELHRAREAIARCLAE